MKQVFSDKEPHNIIVRHIWADGLEHETRRYRTETHLDTVEALDHEIFNLPAETVRLVFDVALPPR